MTDQTITIDGNLLFRYLTGNKSNMILSEIQIKDFLLQVTKLGYKYFGEEIKVMVIQSSPGTIKVSIKYPDLLAQEVNLTMTANEEIFEKNKILSPIIYCQNCDSVPPHYVIAIAKTKYFWCKSCYLKYRRENNDL